MQSTLLHTVLAALRVTVAAFTLALVALLAVGVADVAAFNSGAARLEQSWKADEASGVTHDQLASAWSGLQALRNRRILFLPYSLFSGAAFHNPFGGIEALAARGQAQALSSARQRALDDLLHLKDVGGPNYDQLDSRTTQLRAARRLSDYVRLANALEAEAKQLADARDQVSQASGGLSDGLPKDVVDGVARLQGVVSAASQAQVSTEPASQALAHAQSYLKLGYPMQAEQHSGIAAEVKSSGDTVQHRLDTKAQADGLLGQLPGLLALASRYDVTGSVVSQATLSKAEMESAEGAGDDGRMDAATAALKRAVDALSSAVASARQAVLQAGTGCIDNAPPQLIIIHLATQSLIAYDNGCPILKTLVTTGRPELPTDRGTFQIFAKYPTYLMHSPWPKGSPFWYADATVYNAMEFVSDGTFIHSAGWQPANTYGPGSQYGPYASHGCVHVQDGPLAQLYNWAQKGATVIVTD